MFAHILAVSVLLGGAAAACPKLPGIPAVTAMQKNYPALGQIAKIQAGDTEATKLFAALNANSTYAAALAHPPKKLKNSNPDFSQRSTPSDCWWSDNGCTTSKLDYIPPDVTVCPEPGVYGLSVDDGPVDAHCDLLALYKQENIRASFFYIGTNVLTYPAAAQEAHNDGHTLCVHTWSHNYLTSLTNEQVFAELLYTKRAIKQVVGVTPRCWRPPFGDLDDRVRTIALSLDLGAAWIWNADTDDWEVDEPNGASIAAREFDKVIAGASTTTGALVLNHESSEKIVGLFVDRYPKIKAAFSHVLGGEVCRNITAPYPEPITYPNFADYVAGKRADTMQTLKAVADANAKMVFSSDAQAGPTSSTPATNSSGTGIGRNATTGNSNTGQVVVVVAANGTIVGTQAAGAPLPTISSVVGAASSPFTLGLATLLIPTLASALALRA